MRVSDWIAPLLSCVLAGTGGLFLGRLDARMQGEGAAQEARAAGADQQESLTSAEEVSRRGPGQDLDGLLGMPHSVEGRARLELAVGQLEFEQGERLLDELAGRPVTRANQRLAALLWRRLTELDPTAAYARASQQTAPGDRESATRSVASAWSELDPSGFLHWAQANQPEVSAYANMALRELGEKVGAEAMLEAYRAMPAGRTKRFALLAVADTLALRYPEQLGAFMEGLADAGERSRVAGRLATNWANEDPAGALAWFFQLDASERDGSGRQIIDQWISRGGISEALAWAQERPNTPAADEVLGAASARLVAYDPEQAFGLLQQIQNERIRALALSRLLLSHRVDPAALRPWVEGMPAGDLRLAAVGRLAEGLAPYHPAQAAEFVRTVSGLSEQQRTLLLRRVDRRSLIVPIHVGR